jgi:hypothetical protein
MRGLELDDESMAALSQLMALRVLWLECVYCSEHSLSLPNLRWLQLQGCTGSVLSQPPPPLQASSLLEAMPCQHQHSQVEMWCPLV